MDFGLVTDYPMVAFIVSDKLFAGLLWITNNIFRVELGHGCFAFRNGSKPIDAHFQCNL